MFRPIAVCIIALGTFSLSAQTVDVHAHIITKEYIEVLREHGAELEEGFPLPAWDAERHIASDHFQTYKQGTLHMVKSLDLVDMTPMNPDGMDEIFRKVLH